MSLSPHLRPPLPTNGRGAKRQGLRHYILQSLVVHRFVNTMTYSAELLNLELTQNPSLEEPSGNSHPREGVEALQKSKEA
jgi:hypothetical protein